MPPILDTLVDFYANISLKNSINSDNVLNKTLSNLTFFVNKQSAKLINCQYFAKNVNKMF